MATLDTYREAFPNARLSRKPNGVLEVAIIACDSISSPLCASRPLPTSIWINERRSRRLPSGPLSFRPWIGRCPTWV